jgi:hypothetical protein
MKPCWAESTALANWTARELDRRDVVRLPGDSKLPPMPEIKPTRKGGKVRKGLYGAASLLFEFAGGHWKGAAICASSIIRAVERKYRSERKAIVWSGERAPARFRYPYPYPVHATCWEAEYRGGKPVLLVKLPGVEGKVEIRLRGGAEFGRQLADFRRVVSGEAKKCQLLITAQRSGSCHRRTTEDKVPGGGQGRLSRITVKLVVDVPAAEARGGRVLTLCTDPDALWVAELDGRRAWLVNADHVQRAAAFEDGYKRRLQRQAEDRKAEGRASKRRKRQAKDRLGALAVKFARRRKSWVQETVSHLVKFCKRQGVAAVLYRDVAHGNVPLPWLFALNERLKQCCEAEGIRLHTKSGAEDAA